MIAICENKFKNYYVDRTKSKGILWQYEKNGYSLKVVFENPLELENNFYYLNYKWTQNEKETVLTLFEDKSKDKKVGLFISEYCYKLIKGKKLFEAQHKEEYCKKIGIYEIGTIIESATDTKAMKSIFVLTYEGWKKYEKPEAVVLYKELQSFYKVVEL